MLEYVFDFVFIGFGIMCMLYPIFFRYDNFKKLDTTAILLFKVTGIILVLWLLYVIIDLFILSNDLEKFIGLNRLFGMYWLSFWLKPITFMIISLFLLVKKFIKLPLFRLLIGILIFSVFIINGNAIQFSFLENSNWSTHNFSVFSLLIKISVYLAVSILANRTINKLRLN